MLLFLRPSAMQHSEARVPQMMLMSYVGTCQPPQGWEDSDRLLVALVGAGIVVLLSYDLRNDFTLADPRFSTATIHRVCSLNKGRTVCTE